MTVPVKQMQVVQNQGVLFVDGGLLAVTVVVASVRKVVAVARLPIRAK